MITPDLHVVESDLGPAEHKLPDIDLGGDQRPRIPDGEYRVAYVDHKTKMYFGYPKVVFRFRVLDMGEQNGTILERFYNVTRIIGKPGTSGRFKPPARGDMLIEFFNCFSAYVTRIDRLPLSLFQNHVVIAKVESTSVNTNQKKLPEELRYSRITELKGVDRDFTG